jgi:hypothetical protein
MQVKEYLDPAGKTTVEITTPKSNNTFVVHKTQDGFALYGIRYKEAAAVPAVLTGRYTKVAQAVKAVASYIEGMKKTDTVVRDERSAARTKAKQAKAKKVTA